MLMIRRALLRSRAEGVGLSIQRGVLRPLMGSTVDAGTCKERVKPNVLVLEDKTEYNIADIPEPLLKELVRYPNWQIPRLMSANNVSGLFWFQRNHGREYSGGVQAF